MTRLNLIDPSHLTKRHLVAEYKEMTQGLHIYKKRFDRKHPNNDVPKEYTLNGGHILFFLPRGLYLYNRMIALFADMQRRGINSDIEKYNQRLERIRSIYPDEYWNDYIPTPEAYKIVIERVAARVLQKPHFYPDANVFFDNLHHYGKDFVLDANSHPVAAINYETLKRRKMKALQNEISTDIPRTTKVSRIRAASD